VDVFGMMGFIFGIIALGTASSAQAQIAALKQEVETLKAAQQDRSA
jgi:cell division protein FtsB